jgi:hypothetical protein
MVVGILGTFVPIVVGGTGCGSADGQPIARRWL